jgi:hypothetical protein
MDVDEPHRSGERRDPIGNPVLCALSSPLGLLDEGGVRL